MQAAIDRAMSDPALCEDGIVIVAAGVDVRREIIWTMIETDDEDRAAAVLEAHCGYPLSGSRS